MKPARQGDPSTSQDAADNDATLRKRLMPFISEALLVHGLRGAVLDEIWGYVRERTLVQGRDSVGPRMVQMERQKLVWRRLIGHTPKGDPIYEQRKSGRTGRSQEIWWDYSFRDQVVRAEELDPQADYDPTIQPYDEPLRREPSFPGCPHCGYRHPPDGMCV